MDNATPIRVLILYASIGSGHKIAAKAIAKATADQTPAAKPILVDVLDEKSYLVSSISEILTIFATAVFPGVYHKMWNSDWLASLGARVNHLILENTHLYNSLIDIEPDIIICTHAYPCLIMNSLRKISSGMDDVPMIGVVTDFGIHPYWPIEDMDALVVPTDRIRNFLIAQGNPPEKIFAFGIPVHPSFSRQKTKLESRQALDILPDTHVVLVFAGGASPAPYLAYYSKFVQLALGILRRSKTVNIQWNFMCGQRSPITPLLRTIAKTPQIVVHEYVENIDDWLRAADIIVTKPGGLTIAETLTIGRPLALLSSGAGQEAANAQFIKEEEVGCICEDADAVYQFVVELLAEPDRLEAMSSSARQLGRPNAATDIARLLFLLLDSK